MPSAPPAPDLSPDGRQVAFVARDPTTGPAVLMLMRADGGEPRELFKSAEPNAIRSIAWTPDGRYLLFAKRDELWRIPVEGGEPQELGIAMENLHEIRVHPDGRRIAFTARDARDGGQVWVMENFLREVRGAE